jgi:hypothetical protein
MKRARSAALNKYTSYQQSRRAESTAVTSTLGVYLSPVLVTGMASPLQQLGWAHMGVAGLQRERVLLLESAQAGKGRPRQRPVLVRGARRARKLQRTDQPASPASLSVPGWVASDLAVAAAAAASPPAPESSCLCCCRISTAGALYCSRCRMTRSE